MAFEKGQSGNPNGRPRGSQDRRRLFREMVEPHKQSLVNTAVEMALAGNEQMLKLILDRLLPAKPKSEAIESINLSGSYPSDDGREIITKMGAGDLSAEEANSLLQAITSQTKLIEHTELLERIKKLENKYDEKQN